MELVTPGLAFTFNYPALDLDPSLNVMATIFDATSGTPVLLTTVVMPYVAAGVYTGEFTGVSGKTYLIISVCYTDGTFATVDVNRAPECDVFKTTDAPSTFFGYCYGAYDQADTLFLAANIYDLTAFVAQVPMPHVFAGVYFSSYVGTAGNAYAVIEAVYTSGSYTVVDQTRAPSADSFQFFAPTTPSVLQLALLRAQPTTPRTPGRQVLKFTNGDTTHLDLVAVYGNGLPFDLTGATLTSYIRGTNGAAIAFTTHTINTDQLNFRGYYRINLSSADTASVPPGVNKEIITKVVQGPNTIYFHGPSLLDVLYPVPVQ